jgi:hypothetical protein
MQVKGFSPLIYPDKIEQTIFAGAEIIFTKDKLSFENFNSSVRYTELIFPSMEKAE